MVGSTTAGVKQRGPSPIHHRGPICGVGSGSKCRWWTLLKLARNLQQMQVAHAEPDRVGHWSGFRGRSQAKVLGE